VYNDDGEIYDDHYRKYTLEKQENDPCPCPDRIKCAVTFDKTSIWYEDGVRPNSGRKKRSDAKTNKPS